MAICKICGGEMLEHVGCKIGICNCNGKSYPRIIFGAEKGLRMYLAKMISAQIVLRHLGVFTIWAVI